MNHAYESITTVRFAKFTARVTRRVDVSTIAHFPMGPDPAIEKEAQEVRRLGSDKEAWQVANHFWMVTGVTSVEVVDREGNGGRVFYR